MTNVGAHLDRTGISHRLEEGTTGVDDHRPIAAGANQNLHRLDPFDPGLLHEAEVDGVVDVAVGIHVAPANRDRRDMNQLSPMFHICYFSVLIAAFHTVPY